MAPLIQTKLKSNGILKALSNLLGCELISYSILCARASSYKNINMNKIKCVVIISALLLPISSHGESSYPYIGIPDNIKGAFQAFLNIFDRVKNRYVVEPNTISLMNSCIKGMDLGEGVPYIMINDASIVDQQDVAKRILDIIKSQQSNYTNKDLEEKIVACTEEMVENLDDSSSYLEADYNKPTSNSDMSSIGVVLRREQDKIILSPVEGGPAMLGGIPKSILLEVNQKSVAGYRKTQVLKLLRGQLSTKVSLKIQPLDSSETVEVTLLRADLTKLRLNRTLLARWYREDYAYLKLPNFNANSGKNLSVLINQLLKDKRITPKGIILDLRSNQGGLLSEAVGVSALFLPKDQLVVQLSRRFNYENLKFSSVKTDYIRDPALADFVDDLPNWRTKVPLVILTDKETAGSSEIVASAIKEHKRGLVIGEKTYGDGKIQTIYPMRNGRALKITTSNVYTSSNQPVDIVGIEPDLLIAQTNSSDDNTLEAAITYLRTAELKN